MRCRNCIFCVYITLINKIPFRNYKGQETVIKELISKKLSFCSATYVTPFECAIPKLIIIAKCTFSSKMYRFSWKLYANYDLGVVF